MRIKWLLAILVLIVFISGCLEWDNDEIEPTYNDNAMKMEISIREKEERRRILPGQTIRMVVTLTNQVEKMTGDVDLKIINPSGIHISKVECGSGCVCDIDDKNPKTCDNGWCKFNGCHYDSIQSLDGEEITFALKIPSEEEMSAMGRTLKPKITLEYNYSGTSTLYIPIYDYGEEAKEPKKEFTQTTGPIHVDIDSDNWVRAGDLFPIYVDVKDVAYSSRRLTINNDSFKMEKDHADINEDTIGRCDFTGSGNGPYYPDEDIMLPLANPLVCTLRAEDPGAPMVKAPIIINYEYRYEVENTQTIKVEKAFLGIF